MENIELNTLCPRQYFTSSGYLALLMPHGPVAEMEVPTTPLGTDVLCLTLHPITTD